MTVANTEPITLTPIGRVSSDLKESGQAPHQGMGSGQRAWLELRPEWEAGLEGLNPGRWLWVLTYMHLASEPKMKVHPRGDQTRPLTGLFNTRSPRRPCPLGLTLVRLLELRPTSDGPRLLVEGLEAVDGTPLLDIKPHVLGLDRPPREET